MDDNIIINFNEHDYSAAGAKFKILTFRSCFLLARKLSWKSELFPSPTQEAPPLQPWAACFVV